jgi:hypothetical protein
MATITGSGNLTMSPAKVQGVGEVSASAKDYIASRERLDADDRGPLFHYTSTDGLIGILSRGEIWASSIRHLNDASEFVHTLGLAELSSSNVLANPEYHALDRYLIETLRFSHEVLPDTSRYVASFSKEGDLLSQWRGYCRAGAGYSIGFSVEALKYAAEQNVTKTDSPSPWRLLRCEYDQTTQMKMLQGLLRETHDAFDNLDADDRKLYAQHMASNKAELVVPWDAEFGQGAEYPTWITERAKAYMTSVNEVAPAFKASAFHEEREWRVVSPLAYGGFTDEEYRAGKYCPIPYTKFNLPNVDGRLLVDKIIIGPTDNPDLSLATVKRVCERHHVDVSSWEISDVPFRHWDAK